MNTEPAIVVNGVHKSFKLPHEQHNGIKQAIVNFRKRKKGFENQHVLKGLSFEIKKGEFFGIVGRNGSGKSTLLKLLAGIYTPDKGHIQVNGSLTPFIELGVGFNPELTGRENVYMNGALLGFSNKQMDAMYDEIVDFAELERFMDQKLKNYSSGMQVRLAFSIAIQANTDILVLDEVLAVGDEAFQKKCFDYFRKIKKAGKTVILVTHDMNAVENFCDRAMLVKNGEILKIDTPQKVATSYMIENTKGLRDASSDNELPAEDKGIRITGLEIYKDGKKDTYFNKDEKLTAVLSYEATQQQEVTFGLSFRKTDDTLLAGIGSLNDLGLLKVQKGLGKLTCTIPVSQLKKDAYKVNASIWTESKELLAFLDSTMGKDVPVIYVVDNIPARSGEFILNGKWSEE